MRVNEALAARDAAVEYLDIACRSIREKTSLIEKLRRENDVLDTRLANPRQQSALEARCLDGRESHGHDKEASGATNWYEKELARNRSVIRKLNGKIEVLREQVKEAGCTAHRQEWPSSPCDEISNITMPSLVSIWSSYSLLDCGHLLQVSYLVLDIARQLA